MTMKNIYKFSSFLFAFALLFVACETEETLTITDSEAVFELQQPGISNILLNFGLQDNAAFTVSWNDDVTGGSSYDIEMAITNDFANPQSLGTSTSSSYTTSVADLNMAINAAGPSNYTDIPVYVRVNAGGLMSNTILFLVTAYPEEPAVITSPAQNDVFALMIANASDTAMNVTWDDLGLSGDGSIVYTLEADLAGAAFANAVNLGVAENTTSIEVLTEDLNAAALGLGIEAEMAGDVELRLVSETTNANGNVLTRVSDAVTISVTPYSVEFPYLYFVGDATAPGWNNNNTNTAVFRSQGTPNSYYYTGYFGAGAFKLLEITGQWQPQWGNNGGNLGVNPGGGSDPGTFNVGSAGYYTLNIPSLAEGGSFTFESYDATAAPTYNRIGLIGQAIGGWGDADEIDLIQRDPTNNPHIWYAEGVNFENGQEFLIRPNDDWGNGVWRYTGSSELFGQANLAGGGDNFPHSAPTGAYDFWFNDLDGSYVLIPN